jgi:hypothetical protein
MPYLSLCRLLAVLLAIAPVAAHAQPLFTFGEMRQLQALPVESSKRALSQEEVVLYQNYEFYVYTVFETLGAANEAAVLIDQDPLFCAPEAIFQFHEEGDIVRLADFVTAELSALTEQIGGPVNRYDDKPASAVLLLGLRATFPCEDTEEPQLAARR